MQTLPSSHATVLFTNTQPVLGLQLSVVQTLLSLHVIVDPGTHDPLLQTSPFVHALLSEHALVLLTWTHPVLVLHESVVQI